MKQTAIRADENGRVKNSIPMKIFIECSHVDQLSFWDALIITAAAHADCEIIWTEDLNAGQMIRRVRVENPLQ